MLEARTAVKKLHTYRPPLAGRTGLRLDFNESTVGCSPRVLARLRSLDSELLARYPEREPVEKEVAGFLGLEPAQVLLTNGVDEAIHLLCSTYLDPGDEALIVVPTFAMYTIFAQLHISGKGPARATQRTYPPDRRGESEQSNWSRGCRRCPDSDCASCAASCRARR